MSADLSTFLAFFFLSCFLGAAVGTSTGSVSTVAASDGSGNSSSSRSGAPLRCFFFPIQVVQLSTSSPRPNSTTLEVPGRANESTCDQCEYGVVRTALLRTSVLPAADLGGWHSQVGSAYSVVRLLLLFVSICTNLI